MEDNNLDLIVDNDTVIEEVPTQQENTQIFLVLPNGNNSDTAVDNAHSDEVATPDISATEDLILTSVQVTSQKISAADTTGLKASVLSLIGDYETVVTDYTYTSTNGYTTHSIDIQPDIAWCASAVIFLAVLWSCLKMFSIALRGNHRR